METGKGGRGREMDLRNWIRRLTGTVNSDGNLGDEASSWGNLTRLWGRQGITSVLNLPGLWSSPFSSDCSAHPEGTRFAGIKQLYVILQVKQL